MKQPVQSLTASSKFLFILLFLFAFVLASLFIINNSTFAQSTSSSRTMTISPPSVSVSAAPGEYAEGRLKIINDSEETLNFETFIRDYIVEDNQGTPVILPPDTLSNKYSAATWLGVSPTNFIVPPHTSQELTYFLRVPPNASPGGHYAAVMYQPTNIINVEGTGAGVFTHIGTLFYIHVEGDITEDAEVIKFAAAGLSEYGPVTVTTEIQNNGDLHIKPTGTITVKNMFGQVVASEQISEHNIFPERSFLYTNEFGSRWMLGRYTAEFAGTYGLNNNLPLNATLSFIVFPWKIATIALLIIIIIVLLIIALKRKTRKSERKEEAVHEPQNHDQL